MVGEGKSRLCNYVKISHYHRMDVEKESDIGVILAEIIISYYMDATNGILYSHFKRHNFSSNHHRQSLECGEYV